MNYTECYSPRQGRSEEKTLRTPPARELLYILYYMRWDKYKGTYRTHWTMEKCCGVMDMWHDKGTG